jgi:hypothetical protein
MAPGGCVYLPTYAFQWTVAALHYFRHTGDRTLLEELWAAACRNLAAIRAFWHPDGLHNVAGWNFVDWGYQAEDGPIDTAGNLHYLWSLRCMAEWAQALGQDASAWKAQAGELSTLLKDRIAAKRAKGGWDHVGFHCTTLAMRLGLVSQEEEGLDFLARHWNNCFPNDPSAPRNDNPEEFNARLITPYFAHYVMPLFIERGRMDFVLEQFRRCWGGYMLADGRTTWLEVFDTRWSHCHQWSGCPTWQLSRYGLGLHPRFDLGEAHYDFRLEPGSLPRAVGRLPHPRGGWIDVSWQREQTGIRCRVSTPAPLQLRFPDGKSLAVKNKEDFLVNPGQGRPL